MRSLGRVVRGLSAIFWGLPFALLFGVKTAMQDWLRPLGMAPAVVAAGLLCYGLWQLGHFQKQERVWIAALERAQLLSLVNLGLVPFLHWWNKLPNVTFFAQSVEVLVVTGLLFMLGLNRVLQRLAAMLPDETLRLETNFFATLNRCLLGALAVFLAVYAILLKTRAVWPVSPLAHFLWEWAQQWVLVLLVLLPVALTMTLTWKIKEVILTSVFGPHT
jgi:hypothetical protein